MNTLQPTPASDLRSPLPSRQLQAFCTFFLVVYLWANVVTLYLHCRRVSVLGWQDALLIGLVLVQVLLYLSFSVIPGLTNRPAWRWMRELLMNVTDPTRAQCRPHQAWWWGYFIVSVALVLAACRLDSAFWWGLVVCAGQIAMLPFRTAVPASGVILVAYFINRFDLSELSSWGVGNWLSQLFSVAPILALFLFFGRAMATSAERGRLVLELEAAKRELERARDRELELATLHERERLARDLHDNLGHALVTLTVQLEAAQRLLASDAARTGTLLSGMQALTRSSTEDLRRSLANLRTPGLGEQPLVQTLRTVCTQSATRGAILVDCQLADGADSLPPTVAEALWRVAQEGLTNVEKHAHAQRVEVSLILQAKEVVLRVSDDGVGLPSEAENKPGHFGLRGLRERVEGLGGNFTVAKAEPHGTAITARIPVIS